MEGVCFRKDGDGFESLGNGFGNWCLFLLISLVVSRDFVLGRGAALGKIELNRPPFLGQFKQLFRWEFSSQVFAGFAHYYNI